MSAEKADQRGAAAAEIGAKLDDFLEAAVKEGCRYEGAQQALARGAEAVDGLLAHVDRDVTEEKLELPVAQAIKNYLVKASGVLRNLAADAEIRKYRHQGKIEALEAAVGVAKVFYDAERARAVAIRSGAANGVSRVVGVHPGDPLAERRAEKGEGSSGGTDTR